MIDSNVLLSLSVSGAYNIQRFQIIYALVVFKWQTLESKIYLLECSVEFGMQTIESKV